MIELNGYYCRNSHNNKAIQVLVQYDGRQLYVWHLSDPFYRVRNTNKFRICHPKNDARRIIRFLDGAWIETDDLDGLERLNTAYHNSPTVGRRTFLGRFGTLCVAILILFLISAISLAGLPI